jgi:hypothetical protein
MARIEGPSPFGTARWQRSKEFCNKIGQESTFADRYSSRLEPVTLGVRLGL